VSKQILTACVWSNKSKTFGFIKPFYFTCCHFIFLCVNITDLPISSNCTNTKVINCPNYSYQQTFHICYLNIFMH
jgi:hypothetical protein